MVSALVLAAGLAAGPTQGEIADLQAALATFGAHRARIERELGKDQAIAIGMRLVDDLEGVKAPMPDGYTSADWAELLAQVVKLDTQTVATLATGTIPPLRGATGLFETFVPSRIDGTWQPVAIYIPASAAHLDGGVALLLHGNPQSETELIGAPYFRKLADETGTVLIAPWGRGAYDYEGTAATDVLDTFDTLVTQLTLDRRRRFLVGYSMGGFSVYKKIGTSRAWTAVMSISGAVLNSEVRAVRFAFSDEPLYVVTGKRDESIPSIYGEETAAYLASLGLPVSFYEEPEGHHQVRTFVPKLTAAWRDMIAGVVRPGSAPPVASIPHLNLPQAQIQVTKP